ncbi:MaoC family dehydratase [Chelativorans sp. YIM 93263]|uniref:MaoC family dehydratase n=1 Tax=Chelativorans sp. YIM 93263 TaxID=2906648 RepID=UPI00237822CF|nr:MaoC family dehydratase [Chelativorans sp. YIM 93263]
MNDLFSAIDVGSRVEGSQFAVTRETIREFCDASLDYNPLHLDDEYMKGSFGRTQFGGIIMHGMTNFGLITRMITDWAHEWGAIQRRLETRWLIPVKPGDTIQPFATVKSMKTTDESRWAVLEIEVLNQGGEKVAQGEAQVEFPVREAA